jgi:hypothetical protein
LLTFIALAFMAAVIAALGSSFPPVNVVASPDRHDNIIMRCQVIMRKALAASCGIPAVADKGE